MLTETQLTIQLPASQHPANTTTAHHPPSTKNQQPQSSNCLWVTPPQFYSLLHDVRRYGILLAQFRPAVLAPPCPLPPHHKGSGSCQPAVWPGARWAPSCSNKQCSGTLLTLHTHTHTLPFSHYYHITPFTTVLNCLIYFEPLLICRYRTETAFHPETNTRSSTDPQAQHAICSITLK